MLHTTVVSNETIETYRNNIHRAINDLDIGSINKAVDLIYRCTRDDWRIFTCGNGGSAALSQHLSCDFMKGASNLFRHRVATQSLASDMAMVTAIGNDVGYEHIFAHQLARQTVPDSGDILLCISASGRSPNIINAVKYVKEFRPSIKVIGLTGFNGGALKTLSDINIHVDINEYEEVEDVHTTVMHIMAKLLRRKIEAAS